MKEIVTKLESLKNEIDSLLEYVKYQESMPKLSKLEKKHLEDDLKYMSLATNHEYTEIRYYKSLFGGDSYVQFFYISDKETGQTMSDEISGTPCYAQKMEQLKRYKINEILGEE